MTPVKRRPRGSVHDAVARALEEIQERTGEQGIAVAAATLGCSHSLLYKASDPDMEGVELSLLRAGILTEVHGLRSMAEWLADKAGCDLVEREPAEAPAISEAMSSLGRCVQDLADGEISEADRIDLRAAISLLQGLLDDRGARVMPLKPGARS
jgi:hypothetical protein